MHVELRPLDVLFIKVVESQVLESLEFVGLTPDNPGKLQHLLGCNACLVVLCQLLEHLCHPIVDVKQRREVIRVLAQVPKELKDLLSFLFHVERVQERSYELAARYDN